MSFLDKEGYYSRKSYSQEGEDLILNNYLNSKEKGFYIDIGAFHPYRFSNTYLFYKKGWRGINIDATPGSMSLFKKYRSGDVNIEAAISNGKHKFDYFMFDEPALNGFSKKLSKQREAKTKYKIKKIVQLKTKKLGELLDKYIPKNTKIDFMSIDVENHEYQVLLSNDWKKFHPTYLLVEILQSEFEEIQRGRIYKLLKRKSYSIVGFTGRTLILKYEK